MKPRPGKRFLFEGRSYEVTEVEPKRFTGIDQVTRMAYNFIAGTDGGYPNLEEIPMSSEPTTINDATKYLGKAVEIETREGAIRTATLTEIKWGTMEMDGVEIRFPRRVYLNGDDHDFMPFDTIAKIKNISRA